MAANETRCLAVRHTRAFDGGPLATVDGLPGSGAELRPPQMRALAWALLSAADDCESLLRTTKRGVELRMQYVLDAAS